jgi:hypothetical protein
MKSFIFWTAILLTLIGLVVIFYDQPFFSNKEDGSAQTELVTVKKPEVPAVQYPVPEVPPPAKPRTEANQEKSVEEAPPTLINYDETIQEMLTRLLKEQKQLAVLHLENFIQRFVVTIDSLPEKQISPHHLPIKAPQGKFKVVGSSISPENDKRYTPYIQLAEALGTNQSVTIYVRYYGLFQKAYRELGYPNGHFNDRFVAVIDHLLETPEVKDPIGVVQPLIVYKYADPELEELSAGQKILLRIGSDNRTRVKNMLKELRKGLTNLGAASQS